MHRLMPLAYANTGTLPRMQASTCASPPRRARSREHISVARLSLHYYTLSLTNRGQQCPGLPCTCLTLFEHRELLFCSLHQLSAIHSRGIPGPSDVHFTQINSSTTWILTFQNQQCGRNFQWVILDKNKGPTYF